jgi:hypothetical protein
LRRIAVLGPNPPCGALSDERFVEQLSNRLGLEAFALRPPPGLMLAAADAPLALPRPPGREYAGPVVHVDADTLVWLRFTPGVYFQDWLAGWFDVVLNGSTGRRRRARRAGLLDVVRAFLRRRQPAGPDLVEPLREHVLLVELTSPAQARFWLKLREERVRETLPPRG